jgi:cytoskeletal protein CcmA (bactofilin family)
MFKKDSNQVSTSSGGDINKTNRIVEGTKITGDIVTQADFRLDGELIGNFKSNGKLVIGASGIIKGDVNCKNADIEGRFDGKIQVGIPFSGYPTGVDTGTTVSLGIVSSQSAVFSGDTGTTVFDTSNPSSPYYDPSFDSFS